MSMKMVILGVLAAVSLAGCTSANVCVQRDQFIEFRGNVIQMSQEYIRYVQNDGTLSKRDKYTRVNRVRQAVIKPLNAIQAENNK